VEPATSTLVGNTAGLVERARQRPKPRQIQEGVAKRSRRNERIARLQLARHPVTHQ